MVYDLGDVVRWEFMFFIFDKLLLVIFFVDEVDFFDIDDDEVL